MGREVVVHLEAAYGRAGAWPAPRGVGDDGLTIAAARPSSRPRGRRRARHALAADPADHADRGHRGGGGERDAPEGRSSWPRLGPRDRSRASPSSARASPSAGNVEMRLALAAQRRRRSGGTTARPASASRLAQHARMACSLAWVSSSPSISEEMSCVMSCSCPAKCCRPAAASFIYGSGRTTSACPCSSRAAAAASRPPPRAPGRSATAPSRSGNS